MAVHRNDWLVALCMVLCASALLACSAPALLAAVPGCGDFYGKSVEERIVSAVASSLMLLCLTIVAWHTLNVRKLPAAQGELERLLQMKAQGALLPSIRVRRGNAAAGPRAREATAESLTPGVSEGGFLERLLERKRLT